MRRSRLSRGLLLKGCLYPVAECGHLVDFDVGHGVDWWASAQLVDFFVNCCWLRACGSLLKDLRLDHEVVNPGFSAQVQVCFMTASCVELNGLRRSRFYIRDCLVWGIISHLNRIYCRFDQLGFDRVWDSGLLSFRGNDLWGYLGETASHLPHLGTKNLLESMGVDIVNSHKMRTMRIGHDQKKPSTCLHCKLQQSFTSSNTTNLQ